MLRFLARWFGRDGGGDTQHADVARNERTVAVGCDEICVWVRPANAAELSVRWSDLLGVAIETNDSGPIGEDVWWLLGHAEGVAPFPNTAVGLETVLAAMQERLDGFDNERLAEAMSCATNRTFLLWDRAGRHRTQAG